MRRELVRKRELKGDLLERRGKVKRKEKGTCEQT